MSSTPSVHMVAVGDIMLGRGVGQTNFTNATELLASELLSKLTGDIVTGNLECLIGTAGLPNPTSHSHFQSDPDFARPLIERFDVVTLANNHAADFGDEAIEESLAWLEKIGVRHVGIGASLEEAIEPSLFHIRGQKIAIFGATTVSPLSSHSRYIHAVPCRTLYKRADVLIRDGYRCVLHLHAGGGDICYPAPAIRRLMYEVRQAGFSIVLGHHPHVMQGSDRTSDGTVFFSLGDFVFDKLADGRDQALIVSIEVGEDARADVISSDVVQRTSDLRLFLLSGKARKAAIQRLDELSEMISSGQSDKHYLEWRGSKWRRLIQSVRRDFQVGGIAALRAKFSRINSQKLTDLLFRR
ncbi:MAG: CapA family protein [Beijerinckiaceae bacterium]